jgi:antitoxin VapB
MNQRSQLVRLPREFQFDASEVFIRRRGHEVVLSALATDWSRFLTSDAVASSNFMLGLDL